MEGVAFLLSAKEKICKISKAIFLDKRKLPCWIRFSVNLIIVTLIYWITGVQYSKGGLATSVIPAAVTSFLFSSYNNGEMLYKIQVNIVVNIICGLLGYGLYRFYQHIGPLEFVIIIILIGIVIWPCAKELKDRYDIDMFNAVASVVLPFSASDWLADGLVTKLVGLLIANASMFALSLLIPLWAVDDVRHSILEILDTLAALYRELGKYFREGCVSTNLQDGDVLKLIESFKGSQEKANSSRKFISWENVIPWRQHPQEQYEYIGCLIDRSVSNIKFLFRYLIPKSAEKYSKIEMEELICNEIQNIKHNSQLCKSLEVMCIKTAMALQGLHLSIKHKTTPSASTIDHVNNAKHCASLLMEEKKANHIIGSRLTESVMQMEELANLVEELVSHVHLKQQSLLPLQREGLVKKPFSWRVFKPFS